MTNSSLSSVLKSTVLVSLLALAGCGKDDGSASLKIGEEALESGDSEKAVRHLMTSLEVAPDNVDALVLLGEAQYNLGEPVNARKTALRALELAPNDVDVIELAAKTAFLAKDYEQAESLYQSLCTSDRDAKRRSRGLTGLGILDMARMPTAGENAHFYRDRARTRFLLAIRADAMSAAPRYHLALVYREWGYYGIARDNLAQFLHLDKLENKAGSDRAKRVSSRLLPELDDLISQDLIHEAHAAESRAKHVYERNALAVSVLKRSGEILKWGCKWDSAAFDIYDRLTEQSGKLSRFAYKLAGFLEPYALKKGDLGESNDMRQVVLEETLHTLKQTEGAGEVLTKECLEAYLKEQSVKDHPEDFLGLFMCEAFINRPRD